MGPGFPSFPVSWFLLVFIGFWGSETSRNQNAGLLMNGRWTISFNITVNCNNNSWTAYISVKFYTIYMIFTYNSIVIMLTWTSSWRQAIKNCHTHISRQCHSHSHWRPSIINHRFFTPSSLTTLRFQINIINAINMGGMIKYRKFILYKSYLIKITDQ